MLNTVHFGYNRYLICYYKMKASLLYTINVFAGCIIVINMIILLILDY